MCHSGLMSSVAKTAVGSRGLRFWSENVGVRWGVDVVSQFLGFMRSNPHRANILRPDENIVGIGIALDPLGRAFTTLQFVSARTPDATTPPGGSSCGWLPSTIATGAKGPYVRTLECALTAAGAYAGPLDGLYTPAVAAAVKSFQAQRGMKRPSGRADLKTRQMLGLL